MKGITITILSILVVAIAATSSGPSGPANSLNDNLVISATGSPWKIVSTTEQAENMTNYTAFDHKDMHDHVVAHYEKLNAKKDPNDVKVEPEVDEVQKKIDAEKPLNKERDEDINAGVKKLNDVEKEEKEAD